MGMADEKIVTEKIFDNSVNAIVDLHVTRLCVNVFSLDHISLCSFLDHVSDGTNLQITIEQIARDVTNVSVSDQMKKQVELHLKERVTLLMELTRGSNIFNASIEMNCRAYQRGICIKTFCDVANHACRY